MLFALNEAGKLAGARWLMVLGLLVPGVALFAAFYLALAVMATVGLRSLPALVAGAVLLGVTYAGVANIMLNGLGVVLSAPDNPGFLPGMNSAAFNFGAGLSFAVLPVVQVLGSSGAASGLTGYAGGLWLGLALTALALVTSFLIPRPVSAEVSGAPEVAAAPER